MDILARAIKKQANHGVVLRNGTAGWKPVSHSGETMESSGIGGGAGFASTHWSLVLAAGRRSLPASDQALSVLCRAYWYPLYAYARRRLGDLDHAQDLTQDFFARLLEKNILAGAQPERGHFRAFLLTAFKNFLTNEGEKARAEKRGGGRAFLPLDFRAGDSRYDREPAHAWTPERLFERQWALTLLEQVLAALRAEYAADGKEELFDRLKVYLTGETAASYADCAPALGMSEGAIKVAAHRLRARYRALLRWEVAQTVADPAEVDDEIRRLFDALA
jgi:RNA polymerase sigma factor (sigma-70 family)